MAGLNSIRPIYARGGGGFTIKHTLSYMIILHIFIIHVQILRRRAFVPEIVSLRKHNVKLNYNFFLCNPQNGFIYSLQLNSQKQNHHVRNTF